MVQAFRLAATTTPDAGREHDQTLPLAGRYRARRREISHASARASRRVRYGAQLTFCGVAGPVRTFVLG
jgi:hypothetical protein